ncbi:oxidoreductase [Klebsiella pneumoniae]|nr:oxidoreductase [Klebsiella pneumoniae]
MARRDEIVVATKTFFPWRNSPNTGFLSRKAIFQSIDDSLMRLGMDYVDLFQIHRFDYSTPVEETMEALHDVVKAGKARYIGASSMEAWRFAKMQHTAERKPEHLSTAISALDFSLSDAEITELEARYLPHPVDGIIPPLPDTPPSLTPPSAIQNY